MHKIHKNVDAIDRALYIRNAGTLVLSDFHLGYEEMLTSKGTLIPHFQLKDTIEHLEKIFEKIKKPLKQIIINGDLKHEFGKITSQEWRDILKLLDYLSMHAKEIIIVKGNHDTIVEPIARKRGIEIVKSMRIGGIMIEHGDKVSAEAKDKQIKTIIIGHEHPAIGLRSGRRLETFKCFLKGSWKSKTLIVQPSFNPLIEGTDITRERLLSPYLKSISNFNVYIVGKEILDFGKVKDLV